MSEITGFIRFAINEDGTKGKILGIFANDFQLDEYFNTYYTDDIDEFLDLREVRTKQSEINNCLVLATFLYRSVPYFNGEYTESEDIIVVSEVIVLDDNYKVQWQKNLTTEYGTLTSEDSTNMRINSDISEWEEFYDDDYEPFQYKKKGFNLNL